MNGEGETIPMQTRSKYKIDDNILNHELRRKLWDGMLPLRIELSLNDTLSIKRPSSLYVSILTSNERRSWRLVKITFTSYWTK